MFLLSIDKLFLSFFFVLKHPAATVTVKEKRKKKKKKEKKKKQQLHL